ncbi:MAG: T9SS type A sorting domain-containing protein [Bacteroidetes bacterium]|nr:T9SS type A sorting domain-containing protein [Bacteroidota bacterium]
MKKLLLGIFILISTICYSQNEGNIWLTGYHGNPPWQRPYGMSVIDFSSGIADTSYSTAKMNFNMTCAIVSDSSGRLLFYTNGDFIADATHDTMMNGGELTPGVYATTRGSYGFSIPQGDIFIKDPGNPNEYYLFHETITNVPIVGQQVKELFYSKINMQLNGGVGAVTSKNNILIDTLLLNGALTAVKHGNGRDWWLQSHCYGTTVYLRYLITPYGINGPYLQDIGSVVGHGSSGGAAFSPDGRFYIQSNNEMGIDLFSFDRCSGNLDKFLHLTIPDTPLVLAPAFSPNSKVLYINTENKIYQFNLIASNIDSTRTLVATYDGFCDPSPPFYCQFYFPMLAPDNKIYYTVTNSCSYYHVIEFPDNIGLACNVLQHSFTLPTYSGFTIPNEYNYHLESDSNSICDTITSVNFNNYKNESSFQIFPNPATNTVEFLIDHFTRNEIELNIYNIDGRFVKKIKMTSSYTSLNTDSFERGIYMVRMNDGLSAITKLLVLQ